jgi:hypothetical protein
MRSETEVLTASDTSIREDAEVARTTSNGSAFAAEKQDLLFQCAVALEHCRDESGYEAFSAVEALKVHRGEAEKLMQDRGGARESRSEGGGEKRAHAVTCPRPSLSALSPPLESARLPARRLRSLSPFLLGHGGQDEDPGLPPLLRSASPSPLPRYRPSLRRRTLRRTSPTA